MKSALVFVLVLVFLGLSCGVVIPAKDPSIHYTGRMTFNLDEVAGYDWSGVTISTVVCGATEALLQMQDQFGIYSIVIDEIKTQTIHVNPNPDSNIFLPSTSCHNLSITKITEASNNYNGVSLFSGIVTDAPSLEAHQGGLKVSETESSKETRRLLFIGDGITCGYGVLSDTYDCPTNTASYGREDVTHSYAGYIAQSFRAKSQVLCYTGKGVVHNKDDPQILSDQPMPLFWNRTMALISSVTYDFQKFVPDAVYINLGTNDFASQPQPSSTQFTDGYENFIGEIREQYGSVPIFLACGPIESDSCSYVKQVAKAESATFLLFDTSLLSSSDQGCEGFPNSQGQQKIANASIPVMANVLGW